MGAYAHMLDFYHDLIEKAQAYNYPESSICILKGNNVELQQNFPEIYNNLLSCRYNRDKRTALEYGRDLVASWLFEDFLIENLSYAGLTISGAGADKNREVLPHSRVSSSSDCLVSYNGKERQLELMSDYTGYWAKTGRMELRDEKFKKMQDSCSLFLGVSTVDNQYILLDMGGEFEYRFIPSYFLYGGKPAYSITLPKASMKVFHFDELAQDIIRIL